MKKAKGTSKKFLFGLAISLVLAMAVGSFALSETQTQASPRAAEAQSLVGATAGAFTVIGGTQGTDYDFTGTSGTNGVLTIHPQSAGTNITISNTGTTTDRIEVTSAATITLAGANIDRSSITTNEPAALTITDNATFDVKILLADNTTNILKGAAGDTYSAGSPGIDKSDDGSVDVDTLGTLTIGVPDGSQGTGKLGATGGIQGAGIGGGQYGSGSNITINGGEVTANGGSWGAGIGGGGHRTNGSGITISGGKVTATGGNGGAGIGGGVGGGGSNITITGGKVTATGESAGAGIGGGYGSNGSEIEITGGEVTATGGQGAAGIGGGNYGGSGSSNSLNGDAVVLATSGSASKAALEGFDSRLTQGIAFTGLGTAFDTDGRATDVSWDEGTVYGDTTLLDNLEIPVTLTVPEDQSLTVNQGVALKVPTGKTLKNDGTITINNTATINCQGTITTKTDFYREGSTDVYATGYQTYQTSAGVHKYTNLPNPDDSNARFFDGWYTQPDGEGTKVDENTNVLLNEHNFYEYKSGKYDITITQPEHGTVTVDPEDPEPGDEVIITVTPEEGYKIDGLPIVKTDDGRIIEVVPTGNPNEYKFIMPNGNVTIEVHFVLISEPTVDPGVKTGDSFAGVAALAILGLAATGAALLCKRK